MQAVCAICGCKPATTRDHIPPKSLYPKPIDGDINLNTVPACAQCNNGSSRDDEAFKVLIGVATGEFQDVPLKVIDSLARTIGRNSRIASQIFSTKKMVLTNLRGPILEPAVSITFDFEPYDRVITRIVRALYWIETNQALPADAQITVLPGHEIPQSLGSDLMQLMLQLPLRKLNKDTFLYRFQIEDGGNQLWGMQFFSRHTAYAYVRGPPYASYIKMEQFLDGKQ
jgi:hypothetical protein